MCKLIKALYGTKQAGNAWQKLVRRIVESIGGKVVLVDNAVYRMEDGDGWCLVSTHVDDFFVLYNERGKKLRDRLFNAMRQRMEITNLGRVSWALGAAIQADRERGRLEITQGAFARELATEYVKGYKEEIWCKRHTRS